MTKGSAQKQASGTALAQYQRLEAMGLWRDKADAQKREVVVSMRQATLIISDPRSENYLSHWSLPAITRMNPGQEPAIYAPAPDAEESLELSDSEMVEALHRVASVVGQGQAKKGRLRGFLVGTTLVAALGVAVFVLPAALRSHTAAMVPAAARAEIGQRILDDVLRLTGQPCTGELGLPALGQLAERALGETNTPILYVLAEGLSRPAHLPGGTILLPRSLIRENSPEALAGAALSEDLAAKEADPLLDLLNHAGLKASIELLTSGSLPQTAINGYGEVLLRQPSADLSVQTLSEAFAKAEIPLSPWAQWRAPNSEGTASLVAADPFKGKVAPPILSDDDWMALQGLCSG